ncbi:nuclear protein MDM1-like isoform X6 [Macrotis lagotis]|uniref:nuclear protein MDM1-like isoform X6 n=1 Tax=Macrotis lagotis TaxID=92651 RepID=UPI003D686CAE
MPVRFRGLSEYQRNFLWKKSHLSDLSNSLESQKHPWSGLRSDQIGITKEPSFISKKRVPYYDPQISKYLEWKSEDASENELVVLPEPEVPKGTELQEKDGLNEGRILTREAPRVLKRVCSHSADSQVEVIDPVDDDKEEISDPTPMKENTETQKPTQGLSENVHDQLDRILRRKVGLPVAPTYHSLRNSEYQRQFVWKTPKENSPILAANQVFFSKNKSVPPFNVDVTIPETEYKRNFKGLSPNKERRYGHDLKENENPKIDSPEKCSKKENSKQRKAEMEPDDKISPHISQRKVNTEYRAKFLSPSQYLYRDGAWKQVRENTLNQGFQNTLNFLWYAEVKELREKAESYRKRILGTHFSRDHLNQILSDNNCVWDVSSVSSSEGTISNNIRALDLAGETASLPSASADLSDSSSVSSGKGGRLPTPKLKELGGAPRTHHDLTTPTIGGAVLVSPSKVKSSFPEHREKKPSPDFLGETSKSNSNRKELGPRPLLTPLAAGLKTMDPLPLRDEIEVSISKPEVVPTGQKLPEHSIKVPVLGPRPLGAPSYWNPSCRIQGALRNAEFQHNGNLESPRTGHYHLPYQEINNDEDDDRMSQISARSAASSLMASQTLARAQKRKESFWGKK